MKWIIVKKILNSSYLELSEEEKKEAMKILFGFLGFIFLIMFSVGVFFTPTTTFNFYNIKGLDNIIYIITAIVISLAFFELGFGDIKSIRIIRNLALFILILFIAYYFLNHYSEINYKIIIISLGSLAYLLQALFARNRVKHARENMLHSSHKRREDKKDV